MSVEKKTIRSLLGIILLDQTYLTITFPLMTLIFFDVKSRLFAPDVSYAVRSIWYGSCVALPSMINIFCAPVLSSLSDVLGRKKILLIEIFSALLFLLSMGSGIYWGHIEFIFLGFVIKGAFSRTNPTALAIIGDTVPKDKKVLYMGYLQFAISIGATIGPFLGGYFSDRFFFNELNFAFPFLLAASLACLNTLLASFYMPETLRYKASMKWEQLHFSAIKQVLVHKDILFISLILLSIQLSWSTYYQFIPPILKTVYGFSPHELGWFIGMIAFWLALATGIGIKFLQRFFTVHQLLLISIGLILLGLIISFLACAALLPGQALFAWLGAAPVAMGDVIAYSCLTALYSNSVAHEKQGKVMGVVFIVTGSAWATTGFFGGMLMSFSPLLPLVVAPAGILAAFVFIKTRFGKKLIFNYAV